MKTTIITAVILIAASAALWFYFNQQPPVGPVKTELTGKWAIDSVDFSKIRDTSKNNLALILFFADSGLTKSTFEFTDSGKFISRFRDSIDEIEPYSFIAESSTLTFGKDSSKKEFSVSFPSPGLLITTGKDKDSISYFMKKIN